MFRHVVLVRWRPEAGPELRDAAREAIAALPSQVPEISGMRCGDAQIQGPPQYDFGVVIDFADRAAWQRYIDHPAHRSYAEGPGRAAVASIASVQHEW